jgi:hypothetical protein
MELRYTASTKLLLALFAAILAVDVYRAATKPVHSVEGYIYDRFVRPSTRQVLAQELPDRDVLYALLERRSVGLFHVSPFSVRLPALLFTVLYLWSIWRLGRRFLGTGRLFLPVVALASLPPLLFPDYFGSAQGRGAAVALQVCAIQWALTVKPRNLNLSGVCLGLSAAARLEFAIPAAVMALAFLAVDRRWTVWTERILIPALVTALVFLVLPLSHAQSASETPGDLAVPGPALDLLRLQAGNQGVRIGTSPGIEPILNFYRAQHRLTHWDRASRNPGSGSFDYYLLAKTDAGLVEQRHLIVLYRDPDFVLARPSHAAM